MQANDPSTTALHVAMHRAAHQVLDQPRVFDDPLARCVLGTEHASQLETDPRWTEQTPLLRLLRASLVARSRYAEDQLHDAVRRGVRQYVSLGAGLDTFSWRNPYPRAVLTVFEVDHPATQNWKRTQFEQAGLQVPETLVFAPVDFETQTIEQGLLQAGFDPGKSSFFSWLGVTPYLSEGAITETLKFVLALPPGSTIVFDYMVAPMLLSPPARRAFHRLAQWVATTSEPFVSWFEPSSLERLLLEMGFRSVTDLDPQAMNARYFQGRGDGLRVGSLTHVINAQV